jgi:hypothetical protein
MALLKRSLQPDFPKTPAYPRTISSEMLFLNLTINQNILTTHVHMHRILLITCTNKGTKCTNYKGRTMKGILSNNKLLKPTKILPYLF